MNHYMLAHLSKNRESDKFRGMSYRKKLVTRTRLVFVKKRNKFIEIPSTTIAWDVFYQDTLLAEFDTLKEVKHFITEKANS